MKIGNNYFLYFIENDKEELYGLGDLEYLTQLIEEYLVTRNMYGKEEIRFKITNKIDMKGINLNDNSKQ